MPPRKGQGDRPRGGKGGKKGGGQRNAWDEGGGEDDYGDRGRRREGKGSKKGGWKDSGDEDYSQKFGGGSQGDDDGGKGGRGGAAGPREGRSQLNSNAPDFQPAGFPYGGLYGASDMTRLWGWQPPVQPMVPMPPLWREYADEHGTPYYYNSKTGLSQWERPTELDPPKPQPPLPPEGGSSAGAEKTKESTGGGRRESGKGEERDEQPRRGGGGSGGGGGGRSEGRGEGGRDRDGGGGARGSNTRGGKRRGGGGKPDDSAAKKEGSEFGPPGCNLFVFHLPDDWTDDDLHEYFAPHGNVVSAKVMKELGTGRSRGFGFVSYEDRVSAATAIKKMQGYKILGKRLKVEFKKGEQGDDKGGDRSEEEDGGSSKKGYPDDERLIGYLRAISAKNVVQSLKESESSRPQEEQFQDEESRDRAASSDGDEGLTPQ